MATLPSHFHLQVVKVIKHELGVAEDQIKIEQHDLRAPYILDIVIEPRSSSMRATATTTPTTTTTTTRQLPVVIEVDGPCHFLQCITSEASGGSGNGEASVVKEDHGGVISNGATGLKRRVLQARVGIDYAAFISVRMPEWNKRNTGPSRAHLLVDKMEMASVDCSAYCANSNLWSSSKVVGA